MFDTLEFNAVSWTLLVLLVALVVLPVVLAKEPDIHPMALYRQSHIAHIREPKESAIHRSLYTPFGLPLVTGLGLPTEKKYVTRDGDIRDIWKLAVEKGNGKMISVKGDDAVEFKLEDLTKDIMALGSYFQSLDAKKVAIYLSNDIENIVASFAAAFYNIPLVILPFDPQGVPSINTLLKRITPDILIAPAGQLPLSDLEGVKLTEVIYVVEPGSQHLDWSSPPGASVKCSVYHDAIKTPAIPAPADLDLTAPALVIIGGKQASAQKKDLEIIEFTHKNIISGVASTITSLPPSQKLSKADVFTPADTLSDLFTRTHLLAALASGATLALTPVAGKNVPLSRILASAHPTVIVASPETLKEIHRDTTSGQMELWHKLIHWFQRQTLSQGRIPAGNFLTRLNDYTRPVSSDSKLRIVFVAEPAGDPESATLTEEELIDLRVFFTARVVYTLKSHKVAGAIAMRNVFDYGVLGQKTGRCAHFGGVCPGAEVRTADWGEYTAGDEGGARGEIVVKGPSVAGGEARLGVVGRWRAEGALEYV
ncbi:hypothetical protein RUND412_002111 [Rhizina undulata]